MTTPDFLDNRTVDPHSEKREVVSHRISGIERAKTRRQLERCLPIGLLSFDKFEPAGHTIYMNVAGTDQLIRTYRLP